MTKDEYIKCNKFYKYITDFNIEFSKSDNDCWRICLNNNKEVNSDNLSFSLYHWSSLDDNPAGRLILIKQYDISLDEPLNVYLKAIVECKHIVQKYRIDNL